MEGGEIKMQILRAKNKSLGFTLIELLVVIAIIGILAAVVLVSLNSARSKSRDARRLSDIHQLQTALELFYNDNGGYPPTGTGNTIAAAAAATTGGTAWSTYFNNAWPTAPTPVDGTCTAGQNTYTYTATGTASNGVNPTYTLTFCTGAITGGLAAGGHTASSAGIQ
jgi:type II secretion system protein G